MAERQNFVVGSDEAYTELWFDDPPPSALQAADRSRIVVFQTLSKRSSMTGYRSGFVAGPPEIVAGTEGGPVRPWGQRRRSSCSGLPSRPGTTSVTSRRPARATARSGCADPAIEPRGWEIVASEATMYLWVVGPDPDVLLERGLIVSPGEMFGPSGEGYVRFAPC